MNLHQMISGVIGAVNPHQPATLFISTGAPVQAPDGTLMPAYQTPVSFVGSILGNVLSFTSVSQGKLAPGQTLSGSGVLPSTIIVSEGGNGTFVLNQDQEIASQSMIANYSIMAQVQDLSQRDLRQLDGLNIQSSEKVIYLSGLLSGIVRVTQKGGDLVVVDGQTFLTTAVLEEWPDWCKVSVTLQNGQ